VGDGTRARAVVVDAGAAEGDDAGADASLAGQGPGPKMRQEDLIATIHALIYQQDLGRGAEEPELAPEAGAKPEPAPGAGAAAAALSSASSPRSARGRAAPLPPAPSPARAPAAAAEPEVIDLLDSDDDDDDDGGGGGGGGGAGGEEVIEVLDSDEEADGGDGGDGDEGGDDGGDGEMEDEEDGAFEGGGYAAQQAQQFEEMQLAYVSSSDPRVREADVRRLAGVLFAPFLREQRLARMPGQKHGVAGRCLSDSVTWEKLQCLGDNE
jgi:hypothetical protein